MSAFHENPDRICTELTFIKPQSAYHKKVFGLLNYLKPLRPNKVDPDQTAPTGPHCLPLYLR